MMWVLFLSSFPPSPFLSENQHSLPSWWKSFRITTISRQLKKNMKYSVKDESESCTQQQRLLSKCQRKWLRQWL